MTKSMWKICNSLSLQRLIQVKADTHKPLFSWSLTIDGYLNDRRRVAPFGLVAQYVVIHFGTGVSWSFGTLRMLRPRPQVQRNISLVVCHEEIDATLRQGWIFIAWWAGD